VNVIQITIGIAIALLWVRLLTSWRLMNWRAVALAIAGTIAILAAALIPNPPRGLVQAGIWGLVLWVFMFRQELVAVMSPREYDFVDGYLTILHRLDRKQHISNEGDPDASVREFERNVRSFEALVAPPAWTSLKADTARELNRRLTMKKLRAKPSSEDLRALDDQWLVVEQQFRDVLKARAGFWTGWPRPMRGRDA
jgi:hypothetical protein